MIQKTLQSLYNKNLAQRYVNWANADKIVEKNGIKETIPNYNYTKLKKNFPLFLMTWIPIVQCGFLSSSKRIPEDKKSSLIFNEIYTAIAGIAITLLMRRHIDKLTDKFVEQAAKVYRVKSAEEREVLKEGITTAVPAAFTIGFCQYLAPVLTTPFATKTTQYLIKKGKIKDPNAQTSLDKKA